MGRLRLGAIVAFTLALAGPAGAAEIGRIASRGEPGNPFDLHVEIRWDRLQESATITREKPGVDASGNPTGRLEDGDELRYSRSLNALVTRVELAVAEDLDLHFEWPYVLADDRSWHFGTVSGAPSGGVPPWSTIEKNDVDADGAPCTAYQDPSLGNPCALFPVAPETTVYHGGRGGDLQVGLSWAIFDDRKDRTKPYWLVGADVTFPTAALYDPAAERGTDWSSPHNVPGKPGAFGEKIWKWDFFTVMSRRIGPIDPYVKARVTLASRSSATYSNCDHAAELAAASTSPTGFPQMNSPSAANCADSAFAKDAAARPPWLAGLTVGTELVPYEDRAEQQKVSLDVRLFADYTSSQRFYNELTDASGRLHQTDEHLTLGGFLGLYLRASRYVQLNATASLATTSAHYLTGEAPGRNGSWSTDPSQLNPNYDWRYDAPGRRFKISEVSLFRLSFAGVLTF